MKVIRVESIEQPDEDSTLYNVTVVINAVGHTFMRYDDAYILYAQWADAYYGCDVTGILWTVLEEQFKEFIRG